MNQKKPLIDRIDIFFLLKQQKLITKKELATKLPTQSYDDYKSTYYRRRICEIFDRSLRREWFIFRYLEDFFYEQRKRSIDKIHSFELPGACIVARNILADIPGEIICSIAARCLNLKNFWIQQRTSQNGFSRVCYITLKERANVLDSIEFMRSVVDKNLKIKFEEFDVSGAQVPIVLFEDSDYEMASSIFSSLCKMFDVNEAEMLEKYFLNTKKKGQASFEKNTAGFMCNALKDVFLYCYTCAHQYDDPLEMMLGCKNHKMTDAALRRREFLRSYQGFNYLKTRTKDEELNKMVSMVGENHYQCEFCGKAFESKNFALNHINNKHGDEVGRIEKEIGDFEKFVSRIDCLMLGFVEGTDDDRIPGFISSEARDNRVIYDMGSVFSGEIVIKK